MITPFVALANVECARPPIAGQIGRKCAIQPATFSARKGKPVHPKQGHRLMKGGFNLRDATNAVLAPKDQARAIRLVALSASNRESALAYAAGRRPVICVSEPVLHAEINTITEQGSKARIFGRSQDEAQYDVNRLVAHKDMVTFPPFNLIISIGGQGASALEAPFKVSGVECVLAQLSCRGTGLATGFFVAMTRALVDDVAPIGEGEFAAYSRDERTVKKGSAGGVAVILARKLRPERPIILISSVINIDPTAQKILFCGVAHEQEPVLSADWLRPCQNEPSKGAPCVPGTSSKTGERGKLGGAAYARLLLDDQFFAQLSVVLIGPCPVRTTLEPVTLADLTSGGAQDTSIATHAYAALERIKASI